MNIIVKKPSFMIRRFLKLIKHLAKNGYIDTLGIQIKPDEYGGYKLLIIGETNFSVYSDLLLEVNDIIANDIEPFGIIVNAKSINGNPDELIDSQMVININNDAIHIVDTSGTTISMNIIDYARKSLPLIKTKYADRIFKGSLDEFIELYSGKIHIPTPLLTGIIYASEGVNPLVKVYKYDSGEIYIKMFSTHKHISYTIRIVY